MREQVTLTVSGQDFGLGSDLLPEFTICIYGVLQLPQAGLQGFVGHVGEALVYGGQCRRCRGRAYPPDHTQFGFKQVASTQLKLINVAVKQQHVPNALEGRCQAVDHSLGVEVVGRACKLKCGLGRALHALLVDLCSVSLEPGPVFPSQELPTDLDSSL